MCQSKHQLRKRASCDENIRHVVGGLRIRACRDDRHGTHRRLPVCWHKQPPMRQTETNPGEAEVSALTAWHRRIIMNNEPAKEGTFHIMTGIYHHPVPLRSNCLGTRVAMRTTVPKSQRMTLQRAGVLKAKTCGEGHYINYNESGNLFLTQMNIEKLNS